MSICSKNILRVFCWAILVLGASSCAEPVGACEGLEGIFDHRYCYNDFTEEECDEYASIEVNGATWKFHEDKTCADYDCPGEGTCE